MPMKKSLLISASMSPAIKAGTPTAASQISFQSVSKTSSGSSWMGYLDGLIVAE